MNKFRTRMLQKNTFLFNSNWKKLYWNISRHFIHFDAVKFKGKYMGLGVQTQNLAIYHAIWDKLLKL